MKQIIIKTVSNTDTAGTEVENLEKLTTEASAPVKYLLILCTIVFLGFFSLGVSFGVLPTFITETLHFDDFMVGIVIGIQSAATLVTRHFSGTICDTKGSKRSVISGLLFCAITGILYLFSNTTSHQPQLSVAILIGGRLSLGLGESLLITGALSWGIGLVGAKYSGKVMAWNGISMYGALAFGAPIGMAMEHHFSLNWAFASVFFLPVLALILALGLKGVIPLGTVRLPFYKVIKSIWRQGSGLALATVGFGVIASFITLYFAQQHWQNASLSLTIFGVAYIFARLLFSHLPDKHGGHLIAFFSLLVEIAGLICIWIATSSEMALAGVALTGFGFSLVFPSLGVEAVKQVSLQNRGVALGAYVAFFDLALGATGPVTGMIAEHLGYASIYLLASVASVIAIMLTHYGRKKTEIRKFENA